MSVIYILSNKIFVLIYLISRSKCVTFPHERMRFLKLKTGTLCLEWAHQMKEKECFELIFENTLLKIFF